MAVAKEQIQQIISENERDFVPEIQAAVEIEILHTQKHRRIL